MGATITTSSGRQYPALDPNHPIPVRPLAGRGLAEYGMLDTSDADFAYDQPSDTLIMRFGDPTRPAIVSACLGDLCFLLDAESEDLVGYQLDNFLAVVVKEEPQLVRVLPIATLRGMSVQEAEKIETRVLSGHGPVRLWLVRMLRASRDQRSPARDTGTERRAVADAFRHFLRSMTPA